MKVVAFLADAVSTRDNLLHVLGGGITRLWREDYPAAMNIDLGFLFTLHPTEAADPHTVRILIQTVDGGEIAKMDGGFQVGEGAQRQPGESLIFPMAITLRPIAIPEPGSYSVEILVDGQHVESLFFMVGAAPPPANREQRRSSGKRPPKKGS